ncbi:hypothetical protein [Alicyclobacillus ferrooxydans]|uniref:Uncharacterized protein n=1 Tax=Alicyclobacillus ferrooxydans TaxID=471514 RepID=A0A0N8PPE3_9BACL|nr:hypothetical protein [Alicyclobacillus ferrooxydans]KPV44085.1 hypothetical protein AN477_08380 [Alicyclobacillus ferrooxydans]
MGKLLAFKTRQIEPAIDRKTFLEMILNEVKRKEVITHFEEKEYAVEKFYVTPQFEIHDNGDGQ